MVLKDRSAVTVETGIHANTLSILKIPGYRSLFTTFNVSCKFLGMSSISPVHFANHLCISDRDSSMVTSASFAYASKISSPITARVS